MVFFWTKKRLAKVRAGRSQKADLQKRSRIQRNEGPLVAGGSLSLGWGAVACHRRTK